MVRESEIPYKRPIRNSWENERHFIIPNVFYKGRTGIYRIFKELTPGVTREKLSAIYELEKAKGNPHPASAPLIWAICESAYNLRDRKSGSSEKLRNFLHRSFQRSMNTLTSIIYSPSGEDQIIHNYGTPDEYSFEEEVIGQSDWVSKIHNKNFLEKLILNSDIEQIYNVSRWISRTSPYLWRLRSKPKTEEEGVFAFISGGNAFDFHCNSDPSKQVATFRVLEVD